MKTSVVCETSAIDSEEEEVAVAAVAAVVATAIEEGAETPSTSEISIFSVGTAETLADLVVGGDASSMISTILGVGEASPDPRPEVGAEDVEVGVVALRIRTAAPPGPTRTPPG